MVPPTVKFMEVCTKQYWEYEHGDLKGKEILLKKADFEKLTVLADWIMNSGNWNFKAVTDSELSWPSSSSCLVVMSLDAKVSLGHLTRQISYVMPA
jgi:hypothetical protein